MNPVDPWSGADNPAGTGPEPGDTPDVRSDPVPEPEASAAPTAAAEAVSAPPSVTSVPPYQQSAPPYGQAVQPYQPVPGPPYPPPVIVSMPQTSGVAVASLVLGIVGFVTCLLGIPALLAIIFGHAGLNDTSDGRKAGRGLAVAGLVLGYLTFIPELVLSIIFLSAMSSSN